jgi:hypothetical protein
MDKKTLLEQLAEKNQIKRDSKILNRANLDTSDNFARGMLDKDVFLAKGSSIDPNVSEPRVRIKGTAPDKIDTKEIKKIMSADDWSKKIAMKRAALKAAKGLPVIGAIAAGLGSQDASAAVPVLGDAESAGMSSEDENMMMAEIQAQKDYRRSQASQDRMEALKKLRELK